MVVCHLCYEVTLNETFVLAFLRLCMHIFTDDLIRIPNLLVLTPYIFLDIFRRSEINSCRLLHRYILLF
jgi:hypothetical protein